MSDYITRLSTLVAQSRPPLHSGSGASGGGVRIPSGGGEAADPLSAAGAGLLKGMAERIDFMTNPERVGERANKTWEMIVGMPDELREQVLRRPEVQKRLQTYAKARPEMFFKDKGLGGLWNAVDSKSLRLAEEQAKAEKGYTEAVTGKAKAETKQTEVETDQALELQKVKKDTMIADLNSRLIENKKGEIDLETWRKLRGLEVDELSQRLELMKAQKGLYSMETQALIEKLPAEMKQMAAKLQLTESQIKKMAAETDLTRASERAVSGEETRERSLHPQQLELIKAQIANYQQEANLRRAQALEEGRADDAKAIDQMLKAKSQIFDKHKDEILYQGDGVGYAVDLANEVNSWARGLGHEEIKLGKESVSVPKVLTKDYLMKEAIYSVDEAYTAFNKQLVMLKQQPKKLESLVSAVTSMYSKTLGSPYVDAQAMNWLVGAGTQADTFRKIGHMQLVLDDIQPYLTEEERQAIIDGVGDYTPTSKNEGWLNSILSTLAGGK